MASLTTRELERLETEFVDKYDLDSVIFALSEICLDKAAHVESNWGDRELAKLWRKHGKLLVGVANKMEPHW